MKSFIESSNINDPNGGKKYKLAIFCDIKRAFSSSSRRSLFIDLFYKLDNDVFLHKIRRLFASMTLSVDLGFCTIDSIKYQVGIPEGSCSSGFLFCIMLASCVQRVLDLFPSIEAKCYSDDVTFMLESVSQAKAVFRQFSLCLSYFNLKLDMTKQQFIRLGPSDIGEEIILTNHLNESHNIKVSENAKILGYFISDKIGFDVLKHMDLRCNNANFV